MLETVVEIFKNLAVKIGVLVAGLSTVAVVATPSAVPVSETPGPVPAVESTSSAQVSETSCTVTVNGETKTYTYQSDNGSQTVVCGSQNGQSFSQKVDTGEIMQKIDGEVNNIKATLKSNFPGLGL
ncbi:MAG: hypothetical protein ABSA43_01135 [Candidatus Microgenomates bacterium]|jgi:hypothetical protein